MTDAELNITGPGLEDKTLYQLNTAELRDLREYHKWIRSIARRELTLQCKLAYHALKRRGVRAEIGYQKRCEALDNYLAGKIDENQYKTILKNWDEQYPLRTNYKLRIELLEDFIKREDAICARLKVLIKERGGAGRMPYDPSKRLSKYNQPGFMANKLRPREKDNSLYPKDRGRF